MRRVIVAEPQSKGASKTNAPPLRPLPPNLSFSYEEDASPELFFVPYVQALASAYTPDLGSSPLELFTTKK